MMHLCTVSLGACLIVQNSKIWNALPKRSMPAGSCMRALHPGIASLVKAVSQTLTHVKTDVESSSPKAAECCFSVASNHQMVPLLILKLIAQLQCAVHTYCIGFGAPTL